MSTKLTMKDQRAISVISSGAGFFPVTLYLEPYGDGLKLIVESSDEIRPVIKIPFSAMLNLAHQLQTAGSLKETLTWKPHDLGRAWLRLVPKKNQVMTCRVLVWTLVVGTAVSFKIEVSKLNQLGDALKAYAEQHS